MAPEITFSIASLTCMKYLEIALMQQYAQECKRNPNKSPNQVFKPRMDVYEDTDSQTVTAHLELPGIKPTDVKIWLCDHDKLTVSGKRSAPTLSGPGARCPVRELEYGPFKRSMTLPLGIQPHQMSASMSDGILFLSWPKDPQRLPPNEEEESDVITLCDRSTLWDGITLCDYDVAC